MISVATTRLGVAKKSMAAYGWTGVFDVEVPSEQTFTALCAFKDVSV